MIEAIFIVFFSWNSFFDSNLHADHGIKNSNLLFASLNEESHPTRIKSRINEDEMTPVTKKSLVSVSLFLQKWFTEVCVFKERDSKNDDCSNVNVRELSSSIQNKTVAKSNKFHIGHFRSFGFLAENGHFDST